MSDLKQATKIALIWSTFDKVGMQIIAFIVAIFTARLIPSSAFGVIGSLTIFTALSSMILDSGLSIALIRKTDATQRDYNTVFYFNLAISLFLFTVLFFCAPLISEYYNQPVMVVVARVLAVNIVISGLGFVQSTILVKRMDFKRLAAANMLSVMAGGVVSVCMAITGYGVWALVFQFVVAATTKTIMLWLLCRWMPMAIFSIETFKSLYSFSYKLMIGNIINTFSMNFYSSILGRYFPMAQVGYYVQANKIKDMGASVIWNGFGSSTYSMLSNLQDDPLRLKRAVRKTMRTVAFVAFPAMGGLAVVAYPLIDVLITAEKWGDSVPYIQLLSIAAIFFILTHMNGNLIKLSGHAGTIIKLELANALTLILFLFLTIGFGLKVAIVSDIISKIIIYGCYMRINSKLMDYKCSEQIRDILPAASVSFVMCGIVYLLGYAISNNFVLLVSQIALGALIYFAINKLLGSTILDEILDTIRKKSK